MNKYRLLAAAGIAAVILTLIFFVKFSENPEPQFTDVKADTLTQEIKETPRVTRTLYGFPLDSLVVIEERVKRNQNLSDILSNYNVSMATIHQLAVKSKDVFDVRKIVTNRKYTLLCKTDSLKTARALIYEPNPVEYVIFNLQDSLEVKKGEKEVEIREQTFSGVIEYSLAETMDEQNITPQLTNLFVDVFGWQVDFFRLQKGDRFKIIYEEKFVNDESIGIGKIIGAAFEHMGSEMVAVGFDQGDGYDYFDEDGQSLRKAFLKYPLEFTRISSRYSGRRFHPVLKRWKSHLGTDFVAPRGTPIRTVGDGTVTEAGYKGGNGNYVKVEHNATYTTQYLHMSKIASGMRPGVRVKQGQTIGYVGSTGLATGNHLCYRFWKNGVQIDALTVELPPAEPVKEDKVEAYEQVKTKTLQRLHEIAYPLGEVIMARNTE